MGIPALVIISGTVSVLPVGGLLMTRIFGYRHANLPLMFVFLIYVLWCFANGLLSQMIFINLTVFF